MTPCEQMKMYMENRLARAGVVIIDDPKSLFRLSPFPRDLRGNLEDMAY